MTYSEEEPQRICDTVEFQSLILDHLRSIGDLPKLGLTIHSSDDGLIGVFLSDLSPDNPGKEVVASFNTNEYKNADEYTLLKSTEGKNAILNPLARLVAEKSKSMALRDAKDLIKDSTIRSYIFAYSFYVYLLEKMISSLERRLDKNDIAVNPKDLELMKNEHDALISFDESQKHDWVLSIKGLR
jgi:hypothetical protein